MWDSLRSRLLSAIVVAAAILLGFAAFSGNVQRSHAACLSRGGEVVLDLDERGVTLVQWCLLPDGTRARI